MVNNMMIEMKNGAFTYNDMPYNFEFKTSLSAIERQMFVKTVVSNLVDNNGYDVVIKDLIFDYAIIEFFTNIDTFFINMKDENDNDINPIIIIEHFLESTNVVDIVKANVEDGLIDELNKAVELNIQYLTGIHPSPLSEAIASLVGTIEKKIGGIDLDGVMEMVQKFAGMTEDFTPESIVNAYLDSDMHKKNLEEIKEAKETKGS